MAPADVLSMFLAQSIRLSSTVERVVGLADVVPAVAAYLDRLRLPKHGVCCPALAYLGWDVAGLDVRPAQAGPSSGNPCAVGISGVAAAVAETGTLVLVSSAGSSASSGSGLFLADTHIAVVLASQVVPALEDAFARVRGPHGQGGLGGMPRALNLMSGPSRATGRLHIVLCESL